MADIYDTWKGQGGEKVSCFAILTKPAVQPAAMVHDRMPVILHPEEEDIWMDRQITEFSRLKELFRNYEALTLKVYPVSSLVDSVRYNLPQLIFEKID